jgi:hypothetical protein
MLRPWRRAYNVSMVRRGVADLPLHGGRVPAWLADRMTALGAAIAESIVHHYGVGEFLSRLSDPYWFQALGAVMGMDWHSSGITTSVMGALKRGLAPRSRELGLWICGGRGRHSRRTPEELRAAASATGLDGEALVRTSRLTARVDNNAIADGFQIYLHTFAVAASGEWAVVQQGMNEAARTARRYHWCSATVRDFTSAPHTAIVGEPQGVLMNLVDGGAGPAQQALLAIAREHPERTLAEARRLVMPARHDVRAADIDLKRLGAVLAAAYEREFRDFAGLLLLENLGPRTLQSLALVAEVVHGAPTCFDDPARFSFAHGGKDGHPFPVPLRTYDQSIAVLRAALDRARMGDPDKLEGMRRLERFTRAIEARCRPEANFDAAMAHERRISASLDGRTVTSGRGAPGGRAPAPGARATAPSATSPAPASKRPETGQMGLFDE